MSLNPAIPTAQPREQGAFLARNWIVIFIIVMVIYNGLPFLAPVLMNAGWFGPAMLIQRIYSTQCHQLPDRSFFLFGEKFTYSLAEIQAAWQNTTDPRVLHQFVGNAQMGWKVAWSDRMVGMYMGTLIFGVMWWPLRRRIKGINLWGVAALWAPMALDGGSHFISDTLAGIGQGFRYDNSWLAALTNHALPNWFYSGNALGSFNSDMRLLSGLLFGLGLVLFLLPIIDEAVRGTIKPRVVENKESL